MVLGFLRRLLGGPRSSGQSQSVNRGVDTGPPRPMGEFLEDGRYVPHPEELARAEPLPQLLLEVEEVLGRVPEEEYGWVLLNADSWKPVITGGRGHVLAERVMVPGRRYPYEAIIWGPDGKIYLVDALTYAILYEAAEGGKTAREIVEALLAEQLENLPDDYPIKKAFTGPDTHENRELRHGTIAAFYAQMALLRSLGLLR